MDFVDNHHMLSPLAPAHLAPFELRPKVGDACGGGIEMGEGVLRKKTREKVDKSAFAGTGRAEEHHRGPPALGEKTAKEPLGTQKRFLPDKIVQRGGTHPIRKRHRPLALFKEGAAHERCPA
jgi:hypothetical protein